MMQEIINRLLKWSNGFPDSPYIIDINPTDYCNLRCISCWQRNKRFEGKLDSKWYEISDTRLLALADEARELGIKRWEITGGGEPLIRKKLIIEITKKIKKLGMEGNITTNGTLLSKDIIRHLVKITWDSIIFSIDGPDPETNNYLRGSPNAFNKAIEALKLIKKEKDIQNKSRPKIAINVVLSNRNYDKLNPMIVFAHTYNCESIKFEPVTIHSKLGLELKLHQNHTAALYNKIPLAEKLAKKYKITTNLHHLMDTKMIEKSNYVSRTSKNDFLSMPCYEPWYHIVIKVDGTAGPCCIYDKKRLNIKNNTLKDIWFSSYFNTIRKNILKNQLPDFCRICNAGQVAENNGIRKCLNKLV